MLTKDEITGIVLGKKGRKIISEKENNIGNVLIIGGERSSKTYGIVYPTLMTWKGNVFVLDRDGVLYEKVKNIRNNIIQINLEKWDESLSTLKYDDLIYSDIFVKFNIFSDKLNDKLNFICTYFMDYYLLIERKVTIPILFMLDNSEVINKLENIKSYLLLTKMNIKVCMCWQSLRQIEHIYENSGVTEIIGLSNIIVFTDDISRNEFRTIINDGSLDKLRMISKEEVAVMKFQPNNHWAVVNYYLKVNPEKLLKKLILSNNDK